MDGVSYRCCCWLPHPVEFALILSFLLPKKHVFDLCQWSNAMCAHTVVIWTNALCASELMEILCVCCFHANEGEWRTQRENEREEVAMENRSEWVLVAGKRRAHAVKHARITGVEQKQNLLFIKYVSWFLISLLNMFCDECSVRRQRLSKRNERKNLWRDDEMGSTVKLARSDFYYFYFSQSSPVAHAPKCVLCFFSVLFMNDSLVTDIIIFIVCFGAVTQSQFNTSKQNPL